MPRLLFALVLAATAAAAAPLPDGLQPPGASTPKLSWTDFARLHAAVVPPVERWTEIRWETDLATARQRAARENRPLFMWVMDGHPLGCT